jgi:Reverse transcriptase (RNA-dependent DNA polymerase)
MTVSKSGLEASNVRSYRPISNLSVLSKLLDRLVAQQLIYFLKIEDLLPPYQSANRPFHSTETAFLLVMSEILHDSG